MWGDTETLDVHMRRLSAEVEETLRQSERIVTIRDLGYGCQLAPWAVDPSLADTAAI